MKERRKAGTQESTHGGTPCNNVFIVTESSLANSRQIKRKSQLSLFSVISRANFKLKLMKSESPFNKSITLCPPNGSRGFTTTLWLLCIFVLGETCQGISKWERRNLLRPRMVRRVRQGHDQICQLVTFFPVGGGDDGDGCWLVCTIVFGPEYRRYKSLGEGRGKKQGARDFFFG